MAIYYVDAFSEKAFLGNPTAVFIDVANLTNEQKQLLACETNLAVSVFITKSEKANYKLEYYTPKKEISISGHASIAAFWLIAELGKIKPSNEIAKINFETKIGIFNAEIIWKNNKLEKIWIVFEIPQFTEVDLEKNKLADILNVREDKVEADEKLPIIIASIGNPKLLVQISSKEMIDALVPNYDEIERLCRRLKVSGIHLYSFDTYNIGAICYTRHFEPIQGLLETPISGMANGALGAFLVSRGYSKPGSLIFEQGESINRASKVEVKVDLNGKKIGPIKIGGKAKTIFEMKMKDGLF